MGKVIVAFVLAVGSLAAQYAPPSGGGGGGAPTGPCGGDLTGTFPNCTIGAAAVTLAKQSTFAANSIRGNNTGSAATGQDLTVAQVKTLLALSCADLSNASAACSSLNNLALTGVPTAPTPAASDNSTTVPTTAYVTTAITNAVNAAAGRDLVKAATAAVLPNTPTFTHIDSGIGSFFTSSTNSVLVVDGYTPILLDRILVKNQATAANNGIYYVSQLGVAGVTPWILLRAVDYDQPSDMNNTIVPVANNGTTNSLTSWIMTTTVATVDTDAVSFTAFTPNGANILTSTSTVGNFTPASNTVGTICTPVSLTGQSATITATNLLCNGTQAVAGIYRIAVFARTTSGQSGTGNINARVDWHAPSGAQTADQNGSSINGLLNGGASNQALTAGNNSFSAGWGLEGIVAHDGTTHITYAVTRAATGQYDLYITLERLQ